MQGVTILTFEEKYLGLPTPEGRMSKGRFQNLQMSMTKRLIQWGDSLLAQARKEVLIKSVAQALPTYLMGVFKLPFPVCDDLTRMVRNFYGEQHKGKRNCTGGVGMISCNRRGGLELDSEIFACLIKLC